MKTWTSVMAIGTALMITATTLTACGGKPTDIKTPQMTTTVTTVTTERPTATVAAQALTTTTAKPTTTTKRQTTVTTRPTTAVATTKPTVQTTVITTVTAVPTTTTTTKAPVVTTAAPTTTTAKKVVVTTAAPTTATTKATTTAKPQTTTTTKKQTTTAKKTTTTTAVSVTYEVTQEQMDRIRDRFLELVNEERSQNGAQPLEYHEHLNACAQIRSEEIVEFWSHNRPDGSGFDTVIDYDQYMYWTLGENLGHGAHFGGGFYDETYYWVGSDAQIEQAAQTFYSMFYNSPGHHENYLKSKFEDTGIGLTYYIDPENPIAWFYMAQIFGAEIE